MLATPSAASPTIISLSILVTSEDDWLSTTKRDKMLTELNCLGSKVTNSALEKCSWVKTISWAGFSFSQSSNCKCGWLTYNLTVFGAISKREDCTCIALTFTFFAKGMLIKSWASLSLHRKFSLELKRFLQLFFSFCLLFSNY